MGIAGRQQDEVGAQLHPILGDHRLALGDRAELPGEYGDERNRQMLRDENRNADAFGKRLKQHSKRMNSAG